MLDSCDYWIPAFAGMTPLQGLLLLMTCGARLPPPRLPSAKAEGAG